MTTTDTITRPSRNGDRPEGTLRIAQIAPVWLPVPPKGYGGIEAMVSRLADGLVERGHEVTLFASGDSRTKAKLVSHYDEAPGMAEAVDKPHLEFPHVLSAYDQSGQFDVVHDHTFPVGPSIGTQVERAAVVHTIHGPPAHPSARSIYGHLGDRVHLVAISDFQRQATPEVKYAATVYNGIDVDRHPYREDKEDFLLFVGRMNPEKGAHVAVEVANRMGRRLVIAGKMAEPAEKAYFDAEVRPLLTDNIECIGEVDEQTKLDLYARAAATLMPIQWPEPFGLVMVESLACGTPVVALRNGSVPEIVDDGVTGFVADDVDSFTEAVSRIDTIDPAACRKVAETRFSTDAMVSGYEQVYASVSA
ncbi:MAG TPA: glycosyltransferase family 4 protein [Acidimicrobiales bacterium]|nr:glycosyltransferase family 4 protein [Acidimicrobiales bacterium]